jgi:hypothetical protein
MQNIYCLISCHYDENLLGFLAQEAAADHNKTMQEKKMHF